jgi:hypothetical protein
MELAKTKSIIENKILINYFFGQLNLQNFPGFGLV